MIKPIKTLAGISVVIIVFAVYLVASNSDTDDNNTDQPKNAVTIIQSEDSSNIFNNEEGPTTTGLDEKRKADIDKIDSLLGEYYENNSYYPTYQNVIDELSHLTESLPKDYENKDLNGALGEYLYNPFPTDCDNISVDCQTYWLRTLLSNEKRYEKTGR